MEEEAEDTVVLMEVMEVRKAVGAGAAVEADLEAAVVADTIEVLTEAAEVVQEEEEAWGRCHQSLTYESQKLRAVLHLNVSTRLVLHGAALLPSFPVKKKKEVVIHIYTSDLTCL